MHSIYSAPWPTTSGVGARRTRKEGPFYAYARQERHFLPTLANHFLIRTARDPALALPAARRAIAVFAAAAMALGVVAAAATALPARRAGRIDPVHVLKQ
jgi:ABC-type lipoprotein release transport system permease subunit